jgi:hypothetical protein
MDTIDTSRPRKYEFSVLVAIIGILALLLFGALDRIRNEFEEAAMLSEAAAIRVELLDRLAHREAVGGKLPESDNPLRWIARQPVGYIGELDAPPSEGGVWYFDRRHDELAYRFRSGREARFRLVRGRGAADVLGGLAGVGLQRVNSGENVK